MERAFAINSADQWQASVLASWAVALPLLPVAIAVLILQHLGPRANTSPLADPAAMEAARLALSSGALGYATAVVVHVVLSCAAIAAFVAIIRDAERPRERTLAASVLAALIAVLVLLAFVALADRDIAAYRLTYFEYLDFYAAVPDAYFEGGAGLPHLAWAILLPTALGVCAVMSAAAAADLLSTGLPEPDDPDAPRQLRARRRGLRRVLYLLSLVLVTSTFAASVFFHLPAEVYGAEAEATAARVSRHGDVLSVFWGAVYTLTLIATLAVPAARLQRRASGVGAARAAPEAAADDEEDVGDTLVVQMRLVCAVLAPLIAGPVANLLQAVQ